MLAKTTRVARLFDFYGDLLTKKQQLMVKLYYHHDLSLGEIAGQLKVSRQAVHDNLRRAEKILEGYEQKLKLATRYQKMSEKIEWLKAVWEDANLEPEVKNEGKNIFQFLEEMLIP